MALILSRADLQRCLEMPAAIEAMRVAFRALHAGQVQMPPRVSTAISGQGLALLMPSLLQTPERPAFGLKCLTFVPDNGKRGLPRSFATALLLDATSGQTLAIMEGGWLTTVRTGAVSGLATELLARPDTDVLALFGAGAQAPTQVWAVHTVRPLREVRVVNRSDEHYAQLQAVLRRLLGDACPPIVRASSPREALAGASLVTCVTPSTTPLFHAHEVEPGTHINAVGAFTPEMCEVDPEILAQAQIVVDQREAAVEGAGDLLQAHALGRIGGPASWLELGQLVSGEQSGRQSRADITVFKSVGLAIQDLTTALHIYERARAIGVGIEADI